MMMGNHVLCHLVNNCVEDKLHSLKDVLKGLGYFGALFFI